MSEEQDVTLQEQVRNFNALRDLILEEWPSVDAEALDATGGDRQLIVELVAERTEHTKALVKKQLAELEELTQEKKGESNEYAQLKAKLGQLQAKLSEMAGYTRSQISEGISETKVKADEHPLIVLLMAMGLGLILGIFVRGFTVRDR